MYFFLCYMSFNLRGSDTKSHKCSGFYSHLIFIEIIHSCWMVREKQDYNYIVLFFRLGRSDDIQFHTWNWHTDWNYFRVHIFWKWGRTYFLAYTGVFAFMELLSLKSRHQASGSWSNLWIKCKIVHCLNVPGLTTSTKVNCY